MASRTLAHLALLALLSPLGSCASTPPPSRPEVHWTSQYSGTSASLRGVCAVDARTCWASGSGGTYLRTTDGGESWRAAVVPGASQRDFRDVVAFDGETALLLTAGEPGEVWRTGDGGASWRRVYANDAPGVFFDAMAFWDERRGMAFGDPLDGAFLVIETRDGGRSWSRVGRAGLPTPVQGEAGFAASGTSLAVAGEGRVWIGTGGSAARVLHSSDGGRTWSAAPTPMAQGSPSRGIFSLALLEAGFGVAVGGDYLRPGLTEGSAAVTRDGGRTWTSSVGPGPGYRSCVAVAPTAEPVFVSVGEGGASAFRGFDPRWRSIDLPGHHALAFAPEPGPRGARGWAVGASGRVSRIDVRQR